MVVSVGGGEGEFGQELPDDPRLRELADFWLGKGYAEAHGENCPPAG